MPVAIEAQLLGADVAEAVGGAVFGDQDVDQASQLGPADHQRVHHHDRARREIDPVRKRALTTLRSGDVGSETSKDPMTPAARFFSYPSTVTALDRLIGSRRRAPRRSGVAHSPRSAIKLVTGEDMNAIAGAMRARRSRLDEGSPPAPPGRPRPRVKSGRVESPMRADAHASSGHGRKRSSNSRQQTPGSPPTPARQPQDQDSTTRSPSGSSRQDLPSARDKHSTSPSTSPHRGNKDEQRTLCPCMPERAARRPDC